MRIAIAQLNPTVGDFEGNRLKAEAALASLEEPLPDLVVFPELFVTGYPPQDLLERAWFIDRASEATRRFGELSARHPKSGILVGTVTVSDAPTGKGIHNSAVLFEAGKALYTYHKALLPTYDVFDESRYFEAGDGSGVTEFRGEVLGVSLCEDAWNDPTLWPKCVYGFDPIDEQAKSGATLFINLSASPFCVGKDETRYGLASSHARRHGAPFVLVNQVGGNDELVFDGRSLCAAPDGKLVSYLPAFREAVEIVDTEGGPGGSFVRENPVVSVYDALVLGLRDYVAKCGFERVAIGLSGGIDSAVVCAIAADALGSANVRGVTMPSPYSSPGSVDDSRVLASNLGVELDVIPISEIYEAYLDALPPHSPGGTEAIGVTEENIQARIRGNLLMALSNREGYLLLSTGNKSELAVGYCTLYGDMSGGLAVISDVPKTMVYRLAEHVNRERDLIPRAIVEKPPSAELRPDQLDQDTLPPYETLDRILELYVDLGRSVPSIIEEGLDAETVRWVVAAVNGNEYKRRQAAPGLKVTSKAFGTGRRMPIAAKHDPQPGT